MDINIGKLNLTENQIDQFASTSKTGNFRGFSQKDTGDVIAVFITKPTDQELESIKSSLAAIPDIELVKPMVKDLTLEELNQVLRDKGII